MSTASQCPRTYIQMLVRKYEDDWIIGLLIPLIMPSCFVQLNNPRLVSRVLVTSWIQLARLAARHVKRVVSSLRSDDVSFELWAVVFLDVKRSIEVFNNFNVRRVIRIVGAGLQLRHTCAWNVMPYFANQSRERIVCLERRLKIYFRYKFHDLQIFIHKVTKCNETQCIITNIYLLLLETEEIFTGEMTHSTFYGPTEWPNILLIFRSV